MMLKTFVHKRKDVTEQELIEYNSFCQLLPGASSTQIITLIGFKRGGVKLAVVTLLIWMLPACILMGAFSFLISSWGLQVLTTGILKYIGAMAIGFLFFAAIKVFTLSVNNTITWVIMLFSAAVGIFLMRSPFTFPVLIVLAGIVTNFSSKRIPGVSKENRKPIRWQNLWLFVLIFIIAGILSETARKQEWENRKAYNLFENFYRFGSFVFGGGDVLLPMMVDQYVARSPGKDADKPKNFIRMQKQELLTGFGLVRGIPGPTFSVASYAGGMIMKEKGSKMQLLGCILGSVAIFLPSALLVLFFFPVWQYLKKYPVVYRSIEGINAAVVGIMIAGTIYLIQSMHLHEYNYHTLISYFVIAGTFLLLKFTRLPAPAIVAICLLAGYFI